MAAVGGAVSAGDSYGDDPACGYPDTGGCVGGGYTGSAVGGA
jgi:hypothetical protein